MKLRKEFITYFESDLYTKKIIIASNAFTYFIFFTYVFRTTIYLIQENIGSFLLLK